MTCLSSELVTATTRSMENILTGEPSTTVLLKQSDLRKDALRVEKSVPYPMQKIENPFLIGLNRAFSTKTHEVLPLVALRNRKTNFLTTFRPPASSQMKIKGLLREVPLGPMEIEGKLSNSPFSETGEYEA